MNGESETEDRVTDALPREDCSTHKLLYDVAKRFMDIVVALTVLVSLSPLWCVLGAAIALTSRGPMLYRGTVVGRLGHHFTYYKFRTMVDGDDTHHLQWLREYVRMDRPYRGGVYKVIDDPRVTPLGRILRRLSLDEIPQLVNVLRGEMSVVGPRPPIPFEYSMYTSEARRRLTVKPGITGLYQITARSQAPFSTMLSMDMAYIDRRSVGLDLWIMGKTIGVMLSGRGAA